MKNKSRKQSTHPETPATKLLQSRGIEFEPCLYEYETHGGTKVSSEKLGVAEHLVIKTLIMETEKRDPIIVLMHGDRKVSTKSLARQIGCKSVTQCAPDTADRHSGYLVGGTSPFATRKRMPVFMERSILELQSILINGGRRGFLIRIQPGVIVELLSPQLVECATAD